MKLEVGKKVIGSEEDYDELFSFEIQVRPDEKSAWSEAFAFELSHDLAFEFTIPHGYQYRIAEEDYSEEGYRTTVSINGDEVGASSVYEGTMLASHRVDYINEKIVAVQTSDEPEFKMNYPILFLGIGIALIIRFLWVKRRLE